MNPIWIFIKTHVIKSNNVLHSMYLRLQLIKSKRKFQVDTMRKKNEETKIVEKQPNRNQNYPTFISTLVTA